MSKKWVKVGSLRGEEVYYLPNEDRVAVEKLPNVLVIPEENEKREIEENPQIQQNIRMALALLIVGNTGEEEE